MFDTVCCSTVVFGSIISILELGGMKIRHRRKFGMWNLIRV